MLSHGDIDNNVNSNNRNKKHRKLTVREMEKLQTIPVGYTDGVCKTAAIKMIGNGWTVDVIAHIFSFLKDIKP